MNPRILRLGARITSRESRLHWTPGILRSRGFSWLWPCRCLPPRGTTFMIGTRALATATPRRVLLAACGGESGNSSTPPPSGSGTTTTNPCSTALTTNRLKSPAGQRCWRRVTESRHRQEDQYRQERADAVSGGDVGKKNAAEQRAREGRGPRDMAPSTAIASPAAVCPGRW